MNRLQKLFWMFALITLFTMIAERLLFVLFPIYLIQKNFSATEIGLVFSVAALVLIILRTYIGRLSDRYGRKKIMSLGMLIDGFAILFYPVISKIHEFTIVKAVKEIGFTLQRSVEDALHADSFPKNLRPRYLAKLGVVVPLSRAIAAIIGFLLVTYFSLISGFYVAAVSMFITFFIFAVFYRGKNMKEERKKYKFNPFKYSSRFNLIAFTSFIYALCFNIAYLPAFFILANKHLGIQTNTLFLLFLVAYILSTLLVHYTSKVTYSFGKIKILAAATFTTAVFGFLYAFAQSILVFSIALIGISLSFYVWRVSFKTISMDLARPRIRGEQLSFIQTMSGFGNVLGPLISGLLIDLFFIQAPFLVSACLILGMSIILYLKRF